MTDRTALDVAHATMALAPEDDTARLAFYARLAETEFWVLLTAEAEAEVATPRVFDLEAGRFVLVFDRVERLAEFAGATVAYAALPGRAIVAALAGQNVGLGVNLSVAPSSILLEAAAVDWLAATLAHGPDTTEAMPQEFAVPAALPGVVEAALLAAFARAGGVAQAAILAGVGYADSGDLGARKAQVLAFVGADAKDHAALARLISEALVFSGGAAGMLDVVFLDADHPALRAMMRVGRVFDLPAPMVAAEPAQAPAAPGSDPKKPPILR